MKIKLRKILSLLLCCIMLASLLPTAVFADGESLTVTFDSNGHGTAPVAQSVTSGETVTAPEAPSEAGWTFGGWYTEASCENAFDFTSPITGNTTLYAKWTETSAPASFTVTTPEETPAIDSAADALAAMLLSDDDSPLVFDAETPSCSGTGWSWTADERILTLNGAALTVPVTFATDATIVVPAETTSTISVGAEEALVLTNGASVTIRGGGQLNLSSTGGDATVYMDSNTLTIEEAQVYITGAKCAIYDDDCGSITVASGATLDVSGGTKYCMEVYNLTVETGARLTVADSAPASMCALRAYNLTVEDFGIFMLTTTPWDYSEGISVWGSLDIGSNSVTTDGVLFRGMSSGTRPENWIAPDQCTYLKIGGSDPWLDMSSGGSLTVRPCKTVGLQAEAVLKNATGDVSYQWYLADTSSGWTYNPVAGGTTETLTVSLPDEVDGTHYYYRCVTTAEVGGKTLTSAANYTLTVQESWPHVIEITPTSQSEDHMSDYGWKWDAAAATLTLTEATLGAPLVISTNATIVLNGMSAIRFASGTPKTRRCFETMPAPGASTGPVVTLTGSGELSVEPEGTVAGVYLQSTDFTVEKGAKLTVRRTTSPNTGEPGIVASGSDITVNGAVNLWWYSRTALDLDPGSSLTLNDGSRMDVLHSNDCYAICGDGIMTVCGDAILSGRGSANIYMGRTVVSLDDLQIPADATMSNLKRVGSNTLCVETTNDKWAIGLALPALKGEAEPQDAVIGKNETATLSYSAKVVNYDGEVPPVTYQWYLDHSAIPGATGKTCTVGPFGVEGDHEVLCKATAMIGGIAYTVASRTVKIQVTSGLAFRTSLSGKVYTASVGGTAPVVTADAALFEEGSDITYTWYRTADYGPNYKNDAVKVATGKTFKPPITQRGGTYYFCTATAQLADSTKVSADSGVFCVVVAPKDKLPQTEVITLSTDTPTQSHTKQGWAYDASTHTLTLSGMELFTPFQVTTQLRVYLPDLKIVLSSGSENVLKYLGFNMIPATAVITGKGTFRFENVTFSGGTNLDLTVTGGATVIDGQTNYAFSYDSYQDAKLTVENGVFRCDSASLHVKDLTVGAAGKVYTSGLWVGGEARVAGVLSAICPGSNVIQCMVDSHWIYNDYAVNQIALEGTATVVNYTGDTVLIAPAGFKRTPITKVAAIQGTAAAGQTMTAGTVTPTAATVTYYWEFAASANSAEEFWNRCGYGTQYTPDIDKIGKYIRVKAVGAGDYSGTVTSAPVCVGGTGPYLVDILADGKSCDAAFSAATAYTYASSYQDSVTVSAVPLDPAAEVQIENITEGAVFAPDAVTAVNGCSGTVDLYRAPGETHTSNKIRFHVTLGGATRDYLLYVTAYNQSTTVYIYGDTNASVTLAWTENGTPKTVTAAGNVEKAVTLPAGVEATLTGMCTLDGWYLSSFGNFGTEDESATVVDGVRTLTFKTDYYGATRYVSSYNQRCAAPDMTVSWSSDSYGYFLLVEGDTLHLPDSNGYSGDCKLTAALVDENGQEVWIKQDPGSTGFNNFHEDVNGRGQIRRWNGSSMCSLDPTLHYTLKLRYNIGNTYYADEAEYAIEPINSGFSLAENYIVLERPTGTESTEYRVKFGLEKPLGFNVERTGDDHVFCYCSSDENELLVTVAPGAVVGTTYFVLTVVLPDGSTITETLRVDVVDKVGDVTADLTVNSGSINVYTDTSITIPVNISGNPSVITGAKFENQAMDDIFALEATGGRQLCLSLRNITDDGTFDWAAKVKKLIGTRSSKIVLTLADGTSVVTENSYKLAATASAPSVTVSALKFNSFFENPELPLVFTCKNGAVLSAAVDTGKAGIKPPACPVWLEPAADGLSASLISSSLPANKASGKLYLKVSVDGYRLPVQVAVSVSTAYTAPAVKLSATTVTLPSDGNKLYGAPMNLLPNAKGANFASLNITDLRTATRLDLTSAEQVTYAASFRLQVSSFNSFDGSFQLRGTSANEIVPGKVMLIATVGGNPAQQLRLPLTVKVVDASKVTFKTDKTSVTINTALGFNSGLSRDVQTVRIVPSASGFDAGYPTYQVTDLNGQGDFISDGMFHVYSPDRYEYRISTSPYTPAGTYLLLFTVQGAAKPLIVKVTVKRIAPTLKFNPTSVSLDLSTYETQTVKINASNEAFDFKNFNWGYKITDSKGNDCTDLISVYHNWTETKDSEWVLEIYANNGCKNGTYTLTYFDKNMITVKATLKITVKTTIPSVKINNTSVTLNTNLIGQDVAELRLTYPKGYDFRNLHDVQITDSKGNPTSDIYCWFDSDDLELVKIGCNSWGVNPGSTYKVKFNCSFYGANSYINTNYITVTVKTASLSNGRTSITQKLTAGTLDLSKESALKIGNTYTGWNGSSDGGTSAPRVYWYAYHGETMVAHSQNEVLPLPDSWFMDVDPSEGGISLKVDTSSYAWMNNEIEPGSNYKLKVKTVFPEYNTDGTDLVLEKTVAFKLTAGKSTIKAQSSTVVLSKLDRFDSKLVQLTIPADSRPVTDVAVLNAGLSRYDCQLVKDSYGNTYLAIGWKNDTLPLICTGGTVTVQLYLQGNDPARAVPNATVNVTVKTS